MNNCNKFTQDIFFITQKQQIDTHCVCFFSTLNRQSKVLFQESEHFQEGNEIRFSSVYWLELRGCNSTPGYILIKYKVTSVAKCFTDFFFLCLVENYTHIETPPAVRRVQKCYAKRSGGNRSKGYLTYQRLSHIAPLILRSNQKDP